MPTPRPLSQQDPRWSQVKVGSSPYTVAQVGCTITAIAMFSSKDPGWMARNLEFVNGANLVWKSVNKTGDLEWVWRQWSNPRARILEGLKNGEAIILEVPANNQYGGKHWVAVKSGGDSGLTVIDPDMGTKGVERYQPWGTVLSSSHFQVKKSNIMSPQELLNTLRKEKIDLTNISNGQDWNGRLQGLINAGNTEKFYSELFDIIRWSQNKAELIDNPELIEKIEELEKKLAESSELPIGQLEELQNQIDGKNNIIEDLGQEIDQLKMTINDKNEELDKLEADRLRVYNLLQEPANVPEPQEPEKFNWDKFFVGLSKDQTFQRGLRHTVTFAIGVLATQFPDYAPFILGLAGIWGFGTEVQAFQVNQKQIEKEKVK